MTGDHSNTDGVSQLRDRVSELAAQDTDLYEKLAANFEYYLDHVDELESGEFSFHDLPEFDGPEKSAMHAAVLFGFSWASDTDLYIVTDTDGSFVELFGRKDNAERYAETGDYTVNVTRPSGRNPEDSIKEMKSGESELLPKIGAGLEHVYQHEQALIDGEIMDVIETIPHFDRPGKVLLVYSAVFGMRWEYADPALWLVTDEDGVLEGLYGTSRAAAEAALAVGGETTAITPRDNARHAEPNVFTA